jgi:drug/metabolite transporter (DMT)-like permease
MSAQIMKDILLVVASCVLTAMGQIAFKYGMNAISLNPNGHFIGNLFTVLFNPIIILGFVFFGAGAVIWLFALAKLELTYAVPLSGLTYILILIAGFFIFKETVTLTKVVGTLMVAAGIGILSIP